MFTFLIFEERYVHWWRSLCSLPNTVMFTSEDRYVWCILLKASKSNGLRGVFCGYNRIIIEIK